MSCDTVPIVDRPTPGGIDARSWADLPARRPHADSLLKELQLQGTNGHYHRTIDSFWRSTDRAFGGYAAALAFTGAAKESVHPLLLSGHLQFLAPTLIGPVDVVVDVLRAGRYSTAVRATLVQEQRARVVCEAWFAADNTLDGADTADLTSRSVASPDRCPAVTLPEVWNYPFMAAFEERAIDFPVHDADWSDGTGTIELWMRSRIPIGSDLPLLAQLHDVLLVDANLMSSSIRLATAPTDGWSLDYSLLWYAAPSSRKWVRLQSLGGPEVGGYSTAHGWLLHEDGSPLLRAVQLSRFYPV